MIRRIINFPSVKRLILVCLFVAVAASGFGQVSQIKGASSSARSRSGSGDFRSSSGAGVSYFFFNVVGSGIINWQRSVLDKRYDVPSVVSLEVMTHAAIQPSSYYIMNPRIRGNWGIFLTDFRFNYLLEESIGSPKDLSTIDWQVIGFNLVSHQNVNARLSTGVMTENFGEHKSFNETVFGLTVQAGKRNLGASAEYRWANDFNTLTVPRREFSINLQRQIFDRGVFHGFATAGFQYQRYYSEVSVWGVQAGLNVRIYKLRSPDTDSDE